MSGFNFRYTSMDDDKSGKDPDSPPPPATDGPDHLRRPPPVPLSQRGASQSTGSLPSTRNDPLRVVQGHSAAMSRSPTHGSAVTKHGVRQWARTHAQRLSSKVGSVVTGVGSTSSGHALTGDDADASKPQSYPDPKTTTHKLLQSPFKASFTSIGKRGHHRATSDPNISLPQPVQVTDIKSPEERAMEAMVMDKFKFEWAKACRPGITMADLRPNSQPYRPPDSVEMEAAYATFRRKFSSTRASGCSFNRSQGYGVPRGPTITVPEEPSSRQTRFAGDSMDYFSQNRPCQPGLELAGYTEPWKGCSPGRNPLTNPDLPDRSSDPPRSLQDPVQPSPARIPANRYGRYTPTGLSLLRPNPSFRYGAFRDSGLLDPVPDPHPYIPIVRPTWGLEELPERGIRLRDNTVLLNDSALLNKSQKAIQKTYYMRDNPSPPIPAIPEARKHTRTPPHGTTSNPTQHRADSGVRLTFPKASWYSNVSGARTPEDVFPEENTPRRDAPQTSEPSTMRSDSSRTISSEQGRDCSNCGHIDIFPTVHFEYESGNLRPPFRRPDEDVDFDIQYEGGKKRVVSRMYRVTTPDSLTDLVDMWKKDQQFNPSVTPLKIMKKAVDTSDIEHKGADMVSEPASIHNPIDIWHGESATIGKENTNMNKRKGKEQSRVSNVTHVSILKPLAYNPNRPSQPVGIPPHNITWDEAARGSAADRSPTRVTRSRSRSRSKSRTRTSTQPIQHPPGYKYHSPLEQWSVKHREFLELMHRRPEFMKSKDEEDDWKAFSSGGDVPSYLEDPVAAPVKMMWKKFVAWQRELGEYPVETTEELTVEQPSPPTKEGKGKDTAVVLGPENVRQHRGLVVVIPPILSQNPESYTPGERSGSTTSNKGKGKTTAPHDTSSRSETQDTAASEYLDHSGWDPKPDMDHLSDGGYNLAYSRLLRQGTAIEQDMQSNHSDPDMMQELNRLRSIDDDDDELLVAGHKTHAAHSTPTSGQLREKPQQLRTAEITTHPMAEKKNYKAITARHVAEQARLRKIQDEYSPHHNNAQPHNGSPNQPLAQHHDANSKSTRRVSKFSRPKSPTTAMINGIPWTHTTHPTGLSVIPIEHRNPPFNRSMIPLIIPSAALRKGDKLFIATIPSEIQYYLRTSSTGSDTHCTVHTLSMGTLTPSQSTILRSRGMGRATIQYLKLIILDYRTFDGLTMLMAWDPEVAEDSTPRVIELSLVASHLWSMEFFLEAMRLAKKTAEETAIGAGYGFAQVWVAKGVQGEKAWYILGWAEPGQCVLTRATGVAFDEAGGRCVKFRRFCAGMKGMRGMSEVQEGGMRAMGELYGDCGICGETGGMF